MSHEWDTHWRTILWQQFGELFLYNLRHVQHHAAQLNLILRQTIDRAPRWVVKTDRKLEDD